jgi:hypothetical protein
VDHLQVEILFSLGLNSSPLGRCAIVGPSLLGLLLNQVVIILFPRVGLLLRGGVIFHLLFFVFVLVVVVEVDPPGLPGAASVECVVVLLLEDLVGCALDHVGGLFAVDIDLAVFVEDLQEPVDVFCIEVHDFLARNVEVIEFQLLREEVDEVLQLLAGGQFLVLLDLVDLDPQLLEDVVADVEIGAVVDQHFLLDQSRVPHVRTDDLDDLEQVL